MNRRIGCLILLCGILWSGSSVADETDAGPTLEDTPFHGSPQRLPSRAALSGPCQEVATALADTELQAILLRAKTQAVLDQPSLERLTAFMTEYQARIAACQGDRIQQARRGHDFVESDEIRRARLEAEHAARATYETPQRTAALREHEELFDHRRPLPPPPDLEHLFTETCEGLCQRRGGIMARACTPGAIQDAVNRSIAGGTVYLPSCQNMNWQGTVTIRKPITLIGSGANATWLRRSGGPSTMIHVQGVQGFEMCGLTLEGAQAGPEQVLDTGLLLEHSTQFRVHNSRFTHLGVGVNVRGDGNTQRGVIYHNAFIQIVHVAPPTHGYGVEVTGEGAWGPLTLGQDLGVFIEENMFDRVRHSVSSQNGARYIFRHNLIRNPGTGYDGQIDAHGYSGAWEHGTRSYEIYENIIGGDDTKTSGRGIGIRGGDGVIFGNQITRAQVAVQLTNERSGSGIGCHAAHGTKDQIRAVYLWDNHASSLLISCPNLLAEGRDYFLHPPAGYQPLGQHPLRAGRTCSEDTLSAEH